MSRSRIDNIIELRTGNLKVATARQSRSEIVENIGLLLRRRQATPLDGRTLTILFNTNVEALALQKLIFALPKAKQCKRTALLASHQDREG